MTIFYTTYKIISIIKLKNRCFTAIISIYAYRYQIAYSTFRAGVLMIILAIGDVVGKIGCNFLREKLPRLKRLKGIDVVIANGENSADGNGINKATIDFLFSSPLKEWILSNLFFVLIIICIMLIIRTIIIEK